MDAHDSVVGEVICQFYSFFGSLMQVRETVENAQGMTQVERVRILQLLAEMEREYKNSQEWFITRDTQDIRVGVVGTENSLKSALVTVFTDGELDLEGDETDGRSKTKLMVDGKCKLLLIREETGGPSKQVSLWADVIMFVFSYANQDSLREMSNLYHQLRKVREEVPVLLVGVKEGSQPEVVSSGAVRKTVEVMDKCEQRDIQLSEQTIQSVNDLFLKVCRLALTSLPHGSPSLPSCPITQSPSHSSLSGLTKGGLSHASPSQSQSKRRKKTGSRFSKQGSYNVQKQMLTESLGSGRHIPVKEGSINKKSSGIRVEWKKKYLVLSEEELTYYPSLNDYMTQTHGKSLNLKHITVKVPSKRFPVSRATTAPPNNAGVAGMITIDQTDALLNESDNSNSLSPTPPTPIESSLDYINSTPPTLRLSRTGNGVNEQGDNSHDEASLTDSYGELSRQRTALDPMVNGRGHNRNSSIDEVLLQNLRSGGISFPSVDGGEERPATLSRLQRGRADRPRQGFLSVLAPSSEEYLLESPTGSSENIGGKKRGKLDRNSLIIERSSSGADKDKKGKGAANSSGGNHKRQRSWGGNKGEPTGANVETADPTLESPEFQVLSLDGKVWVFEAGTPEEAETWVKSIEEQIKKIYSESVSHKRMNSSSEIEKKAILNMEGNEECADCGASNPEWAAINHGCVLCIECSGIHRKMGAHVSRIRSLTLDEWSPDLVGVMLAVGNRKHHLIWEARRPRNKPIPTSMREEREAFIKAKYISKEFLSDLPPTSKRTSDLLLEAVKESNIVETMRTLPHCRQEDIDRIHDAPHNCTSLHIACTQGNASIVQLLIWSRANINQPDIYQRPPLFYARREEHAAIEKILLDSNCVDDDFSRLSLSSDGGSSEVLHRTRS